MLKGILEGVTLKLKMIGGLVIFILLLALLSMIYAWYTEKNKPQLVTTKFETVEKIKEVIKWKPVYVPGPNILMTIPRETITTEMDMPPWFIGDSNEQAISSGVIPPYKGKTNVIGTLNTKTGKGNIIAKRVPLPLLGFVNEKKLYGKIGMSTNSEIQATAGGQWNFVRTGNIEYGFFAEGRGYFDQGNTNSGNRDNAELIGGIVITY